jgi:hypothetical protein
MRRNQVLAMVLTISTAAKAFANQEPAAPAAVAPPAATAPASQPAATTQSAGRTDGDTPNTRGFSVWGGLPWGGWSVGGRFMMPLKIGPVLKSGSIKDSWALEVGVDYLHISDNYGGVIDISYNEILPVAGIMWNFWFNEKFAVYPKLEAGYAIAWFSSDYGDNIPGYGGLFVSGAGGVLYKLDNGMTLRAEAGISGLKAGVGWLF